MSTASRSRRSARLCPFNNRAHVSLVKTCLISAHGLRQRQTGSRVQSWMLSRMHRHVFSFTKQNKKPQPHMYADSVERIASCPSRFIRRLCSRATSCRERVFRNMSVGESPKTCARAHERALNHTDRQRHAYTRAHTHNVGRVVAAFHTGLTQVLMPPTRPGTWRKLHLESLASYKWR